MDKIIEILSSVVFWSTLVAFLALLSGINQFRKKIKSEDEAIRESRKTHQSVEDKDQKIS